MSLYELHDVENNAKIFLLVYLDISVRTYRLHDPSALKTKPEYSLGAL
jgi:hypothetical protein